MKVNEIIVKVLKWIGMIFIVALVILFVFGLNG